VHERVEGVEGICFIDDLRMVATMKNIHKVVKKLDACTGESSEWASRQNSQPKSECETVLFDSTKMPHHGLESGWTLT
jgi:hypothetical protein